MSIASQTYGYDDITRPNPAPVANTMASSIGALDEVNARGLAIRDRLEKIAAALGAPGVPASNGAVGGPPRPEGLVHVIHERVSNVLGVQSDVGSILTHIEQAIGL